MLNVNRLILGGLLIFCFHGCATQPLVPTLPLGIPLQEICRQYNIQWQFDSVTQVVILSYKDRNAKALVGSPTVLIGQQKVTLSAPLRRQNSTIFVPGDFESKVIGPFGAVRSRIGFTGELANLKIHTIVIDPGHGGKDPGTRGRSGLKEKGVVLDVSERLKSLLQEAGLKVIMTREADIYLTLPERTEVATQSNADLFVSIHANFMPARTTQGIEVYYVRSTSKRDLDEWQRQMNERMFLQHLNAQPSRTLQGIVADMMYQSKVAESGKLARRIVHDVADNVGVPNRGARHCRYFVVRNTLIPAILVEIGFLSNKQEEKKLDSPAYRQKLAESMARSILVYASSS